MTVKPILLAQTPLHVRENFDVEHLRVRLDHGEAHAVEISTVIARRPDVAAVIVFDPGRQQLIFVEQFRAAPFLRSGDGNSIEIIAGYLNPDEDFEEGVRRELKEETGLEALALLHGFSFFPAPTLSVELVDLWCAIVKADHIRSDWVMPGHGELVRCRAMHLDEVRNGLATTRFNNALTLLAIHWLLANIEKLNHLVVK